MGSLTTTAILLRSIDYGESDRVITMLGRSTGCLGAIARGARKSQRRFGGGLGLCSVGDAALRERGGSELLTLERFDVTSSFPSFGTDVARMGHAAYVAELLAKLCAPRQAEPEIFDLGHSFLQHLDAEGGDLTRLRIFELALLGRLGFAPALEECAVCGRSDLSTGTTIDVRFIPDRGGVVCQACAGRGRLMRPVVRLALAGLARLGLADAAVAALPPDVARGCREALHELIAVHLSAPLRSLEFLEKMDNQAAPAPVPNSTPPTLTPAEIESETP
ncbi:MAG: DNA repair protein RecO [Deltaproteobacteria bacterium]|nr:DNA repair protein RecO [Deltaproteobacteria bacterium]